MRPEGNSPLGSSEICAILKECSQSGVSVLKFRDLYVRFDSKVVHIDQKVVEIDPAPLATTPEAEISDNSTEIEAEALAEEHREIEQLRLEMLQLEDPETLEKMILNGEVALNGEESDE